MVSRKTYVILAANALMITICFGSFEFLSFFYLKKLVYYSRPGVFDPSPITQDYKDYLRVRNPVLGWGPISKETGARNDPSFSNATTPCIAMFGDSFTYSIPVGDADTWPATLGKLINCYVANYGEAGYGTDQAYLRFLFFPTAAKIVFLNHMSENIQRNVNQFRNFLYPNPEFGFKPRFVYRNGLLQLVPLPDLTASEINEFFVDPKHFLRNEYFIPGGQDGVVFNRFPYSANFLRLWVFNGSFRDTMYRFYKYKLLAQPPDYPPRYLPFYDANHPSEALITTKEILVSFARKAISLGKTPIIGLVPTCVDLQYFITHNSFPYDPLKTLIAMENIYYIDFGREIIARKPLIDPRSLYKDPNGHFNASGYRLLSEISRDFLISNQILARGDGLVVAH
jgi:hypothetical protein